MRRKLISTLLIIVATLLAIITLSHTATAATLPVSGLQGDDAIVTDQNGKVVTDTTTLAKDTPYEIRYNWQIASDITVKPGDTATVTLPSGLVAKDDTKIPIVTEGGETIGIFTIKEGSTTGTITATQTLNGSQTWRGYLQFYGERDNSGASDAGSAISKVGVITEKDANGMPTKLKWQITINPNSQPIGKAVITDTLSPNQKYVDGSVATEIGKLNILGTIQPNGKTDLPTVAVNGDVITFTFNDVQDAILLSYATTPIGTENGGGFRWENTATLNGKSADAYIQYGGTGTGNGDNAIGGVTLTKTDATNGQVLVGAVYELQDSTGKVIKTGLTTNSDGTLSVSNLPLGDYQFVETKAPAGYELNASPLTFTIVKGQTANVTVNAKDTKETPTTGDVQLTKTDQATKAVLAGAVYDLKDNTGKVVNSGLTTNAQGQLTVKDLAFGDYSFVETQAPAGYELNATPLPFTIAKGQTAMVKVTATDAKTPVVSTTCGVTLTKQDAKTQHALAGAVYDLKDQNGTVIKSGLTTDTNGQLTVTDLKAGQYSFVETKAPTGYDLNETPLPFTITDDQTANVTVTAKDTKSTTPPIVEPALGSVTLIKKAEGTDKHLAGAVYDLQTATGKVIQSVLTTDATGQLTVTKLAAGQYKFVEIKAPAGYKLNPTPLLFTISEHQTATVEVTAIDEAYPNDPEIPIVPGEPEIPVIPGKPEEPTTPTEPGTPSEPEVPTTPTEPETPTTPNRPNVPNKPGYPLTPTYPSASTHGTTTTETPMLPSNALNTAMTGQTGIPQNGHQGTGLPQTNESQNGALALLGALLLALLGFLGIKTWRQH
ncbi:MSCRAMM family protein [Lactiplantibacillus mudanjiangensis]|uniref:Gram-positive cocci surface proteins LPxTG domain-containing protein n=1 Tax=Lactiplantibacillus mudanjiangensis TaxID=1296538 RepID=A0A660DWM3_9LACO|nr:SpaA isopeptide-forming pilin-related protein [Lactiplantibacillus mudanjiangensis]VDG25799.1 hypothetical protein [Lactobacillus pentosus] [Lactiplantibacillus mudanjiangensis]VDG28125.1 hypothetical protein [Lactobacillus pentosus] [Lactiplantibacillus mudanjiangensis]